MATLAQMRAMVIREGDLGDIVANSDIDAVLNDELAALHELMVNTFEDYQATSGTLTITAGNSSVALPATFFKVLGVDDDSETDYPEMPRFDFPDKSRTWRKSYTILGSTFYVRPTDDAPGSYTLWYVPQYTALSADGDTFTCPNRWEQLAVLKAAARFREIQQLDSSQLVQRAEAVRQRIIEAAETRDIGGQQKARDVRRWKRINLQTETRDWEP